MEHQQHQRDYCKLSLWTLGLTASQSISQRSQARRCHLLRTKFRLHRTEIAFTRLPTNALPMSSVGMRGSLWFWACLSNTMPGPPSLLISLKYTYMKPEQTAPYQKASKRGVLSELNPNWFSLPKALIGLITWSEDVIRKPSGRLGKQTTSLGNYHTDIIHRWWLLINRKGEM